MSEVIVEDSIIKILVFREKRQGPNSPEEIIEQAAVEHLSHKWPVVLVEKQFNIVVESVLSCFLVHVLVKEVFKI